MVDHNLIDSPENRIGDTIDRYIEETDSREDRVSWGELYEMSIGIRQDIKSLLF